MAGLKISQVRIVLNNLEKQNGKDAVEAVLRQVGATDADTISPDDYPQIMSLCGHPEWANAAMTCVTDRDNKPSIQDRLAEIARDTYASEKSNDDMKIIINGAPSLREGFDRVSMAMNIRRKSVAS